MKTLAEMTNLELANECFAAMDAGDKARLARGMAEQSRRADATPSPDPHALIAEQESPQAFTRRMLGKLHK